MTTLAVAASQPDYDRVARELHWLIAALAFIVVFARLDERRRAAEYVDA